MPWAGSLEASADSVLQVPRPAARACPARQPGRAPAEPHQHPPWTSKPPHASSRRHHDSTWRTYRVTGAGHPHPAPHQRREDHRLLRNLGHHRVLALAPLRHHRQPAGNTHQRPGCCPGYAPCIKPGGGAGIAVPSTPGHRVAGVGHPEPLAGGGPAWRGVETEIGEVALRSGIVTVAPALATRKSLRNTRWNATTLPAASLSKKRANSL